jgi:hypothetical protein
MIIAIALTSLYLYNRIEALKFEINALKLSATLKEEEFRRTTNNLEELLKAAELAIKTTTERVKSLALLSANSQEQENYINSKYSSSIQCEEEEARLRSALKLVEAKKRNLQKQESQDNMLCVICQDHSKVILLMPCAHLCLCNECNLSSIAQCPLCRANITSRVKVLL